MERVCAKGKRENEIGKKRRKNEREGEERRGRERRIEIEKVAQEMYRPLRMHSLARS